MRVNKELFKFFIFFITLVLIGYIGSLFHINTDTIQDYLNRFPKFYSGLIFIFLYCLVTFFIWLSKDVFRFIAAIVFGAYFSTLFIYIAELINASILFHLARVLGRGFVEKASGRALKKFDEKLSGLNFFWLFLSRATPLVPFRFLDLACGLTNIPFRRYLMAVIFGSPLRIFWVQYILAGVGKGILQNPLALSAYLIENKILFILSWLYFLLVVFVGKRLFH